MTISNEEELERLKEIGRTCAHVRNLASHGVGYTLYDEPGEIATWPDKSERRRMNEGLVFTIKPFLSLGTEWADEGDDDWKLLSEQRALTVQYEHTIVATRNGPLVVTGTN